MAGSAIVEGGPQLASALRSLGKTPGKNILRRVGKKRLEPMADNARSRVAERSGSLKKSITVGTRLSKSQRAARGSYVGGGSFRREAKNTVDVYMGPGQHPQAITEEFGTFNQTPSPYMRPAFDQEAQGVISGLSRDIWTEIEKTAQRAARKRLKAQKG